jgi:hypothetical protein
MNDLKFFNFTLDGPNEFRINGSEERSMQSEIYKIVKKNRCIEKRIEVLQSMGIKLLFPTSCRYVPFYGFARSNCYCAKDWQVGDMVLFYSTGRPKTGNNRAKSYYIQVTNYRVHFSHGGEDPCTVFAEIPVTTVATKMRKLKLIKLNSL